MKKGICFFSYVMIMLLWGLVQPAKGDFYRDFQVTWSSPNVRILDAGEQLQLVLDSNSGSGFQSKNTYMFGNIDMQIKLVPGDSAGTVTAYYLSSSTAYHDELDFEFLGNETGQPYILQTNVYANGVGSREQRIYFWFDPTTEFHTYSISWNPQQVVFLVDGIPIRVFPNKAGLPYLNKQPMAVYSSLWNGDDWATRGGLVKINWAHAPFVASYRNFQANPSGASSVVDLTKLSWVKQNYMVYDYCSDRKRFPSIPPECM